MDLMLFALIAAGLLIAALPRDTICKIDFLSLIGVRPRHSALAQASAGKWSPLVTAAVFLLVVLIAMSGPEARLFFIVIDAIGFDMLVALVALQLRHIGAAVFSFVPMSFSSIRWRDIWTAGLGPHPVIQLTISFATLALGCAWIGANIVMRS